MTHVITVTPGDGIGPEITDAVVRVLEASGVSIEWEEHLPVRVPSNGGRPYYLSSFSTPIRPTRSH